MDNNENNEQEKTSLKISAFTNEEGKKLIEDTYSLYTSQTVEVEEGKREVKKFMSPSLDKETKKSPGTSELKMPEPVIEETPKPTPIVSRVLHKEITSIESLNPELKQQVKQAMSGENKEKIQAAIKEMEISQDKFFTEEGNIFEGLKKADVAVVEKKMAEMKVAKEVTEINVSAIISCIDNLKTKKKR